MIARFPEYKVRRISLIALTAKGADILEKTPEPLHEQISKEKLVELQPALDIILYFLNIQDVDALPIFTAGADITNTERVEAC